MNVYFIGCLHLGHKWMAQFRGFHDEFYHDEKIIDTWNRKVNKRDLVYILGDITLETSKHYYKLNRLKGRKIVVLGNHDRPQDVKELLNYVDNVAGMVDYKGCVLTHAPIHPSEVSFCRRNIHAHIHHKNKLPEIHTPERYGGESKIEYPTLHKYICVDAHLLNYEPKSLVELGIT